VLCYLCFKSVIELAIMYVHKAKRISACSHIRTLLCSLFVVVLAMVVLAVIYLGHLKIVMKCNVKAKVFQNFFVCIRRHA